MAWHNVPLSFICAILLSSDSSKSQSTVIAATAAKKTKLNCDLHELITEEKPHYNCGQYYCTNCPFPMFF